MYDSGHKKRTNPRDGSDEIILRYVYDKPFTIRFPDRSERKEQFEPDRKGGLTWYTDGSKTKALELGCIAMVQGENLVLTLGSAVQYSRRKSMPLRHVQLRIYIGTIKIGTSTFYQTVKLQLNHLANTRSSKNWSGTAINPSYNWPNMTDVN
jgi:hypothetical protein